MAKKQPTIDEQLRRLEEIRLILESGDRPIEQLVQLYEVGIELAKSIREKLQAIRQRIVTLGEQIGADRSTADEG
ncbi:MAG: exodeoxyribonuclease VII small subunit [Chlorobi bacterium]|nr:exodeoxyribonuclease VII small subunit [Chlorobiota bacterium]